ncbi:unnamed protein product, partial [Rotaria magnacalcarata]
SLSYYNEYTRILILYNELVTKYNQLEIDYKSIQSLLQQKNEAYLQCQNELNTYQNLLYHQKKKSDDIDQLRLTLNEREIKIQELLNSENQLLIKKSELEFNLKLLEENNIKLKSNQQLLDQIQLDLKRITHERDLAIVDKKQMENEIEINRKNLLQYEERELKLTNEVERLFQIEKSLRNELEQLENSDQEKTKMIHQFASSDEQSQQELLANFQSLKYECEKIKESNTNLNIRLQEQIQCTQNLQNSLEQFQQDREQNVNEHLFQYQDSLREQISISARLTNENNELQQRLEDANEVLSSMNRLNDEIKAKEILINKLQIEIDHKNKQIFEYNKNFEATNDTRVEKQLVKNILLSYFHTPIDKQQEVVPILSALVGFTQEEYQKVVHSISNNYNNNTSNNWLTGWLSANSSKPKTQSNNSLDQSNKSFAELLIQYVDQQSFDDFSETLSNSNTHECNVHQNSPNLSLSTSDKSTHVSTDEQLTTTISTVSTVEDDIDIDNPPSLPKSSILVDDLSFYLFTNTKRIMAYHSSFANSKFRLGNMALLPIRTSYSGPAPIETSTENEDIIDEALKYFRANIFFRNYDIKHDADRTLIYLTLYITECLRRLQKCQSRIQAQKELSALAISTFPIPGDADFPLNGMFVKPAHSEIDKMKQYLEQLRKECSDRMIDRVIDPETNKPSKWWLCFVRRCFMDKTLLNIGSL